MNTSRLYLHGDKQEGGTGKYYCNACNLFVDREHFDGQCPASNHAERFKRSIVHWERDVAQGIDTTHHRLISAPNLFY